MMKVGNSGSVRIALVTPKLIINHMSVVRSIGGQKPCARDVKVARLVVERLVDRIARQNQEHLLFDVLGQHHIGSDDGIKHDDAPDVHATVVPGPSSSHKLLSTNTMAMAGEAGRVADLSPHGMSTIASSSPNRNFHAILYQQDALITNLLTLMLWFLRHSLTLRYNE